MKLKVVILTGVRNASNPLLADTNLQNKVLLPVGGKPMVQSVLEVAAQSKYQPELYISTNDLDVLRLKTNVSFTPLPSENKAVQSFLKSLERVPGEDWVLFISGDHALLTTEMIDHFIDEVIERDLTLGAAVVSQQLVNQHYPQSKRTYFKVKGGGYSGGNLILINKKKFTGNAGVLEIIDQNRKKPWKSVFLLNFAQVLRILLRQADIHEVAELASQAIGCKCGIVVMPFAECCMDVDKPSDRLLAEMVLKNRQEAGLKVIHGSSCA